MIKEYIVKYMIGSAYGELLIMAHDEEEARKNCAVQAQYRHKSRGKFKIFYMYESDKEDPLIEKLDKYKIS